MANFFESLLRFLRSKAGVLVVLLLSAAAIAAAVARWQLLHATTRITVTHTVTGASITQGPKESYTDSQHSRIVVDYGNGGSGDVKVHLNMAAHNDGGLTGLQYTLERWDPARGEDGAGGYVIFDSQYKCGLAASGQPGWLTDVDLPGPRGITCAPPYGPGREIVFGIVDSDISHPIVLSVTAYSAIGVPTVITAEYMGWGPGIPMPPNR